MIAKIMLLMQTRNLDRGASATEYALIMGLIVVSLIAIMTVFGGAIANQFNSACMELTGRATCL